ncbi:fibronectin type III domain-containing protein [Heyndrickxia oleronia]|uniref:hypothetical protein n=1 Tax=Heyndrickxia oleronia TaxID=38875 RepID=UPI001B22DE0B|nr:hypothetical protein [Heyndrickxia oleronia]GIN39059.1 hypothetical protein J19TS1_20080 [Heyndrickxia oleronia]
MAVFNNYSLTMAESGYYIDVDTMFTPGEIIPSRDISLKQVRVVVGTQGSSRLKIVESATNITVGSFYIPNTNGGMATATIDTQNLLLKTGKRYRLEFDDNNDFLRIYKTTLINPNGLGTYMTWSDSGGQCPTELTYDLPNSAPSIPGAFTQPTGTLEQGDTKAITWGASTDPDGNLKGYKLGVSVNDGPYTEYDLAYSGPSWSYTIPTNATKIKFRVKAYDYAGLESAYRESTVFTVTKPKYYWNKYSIIQRKKYTKRYIDERFGLASGVYGFTNFTFDNVNGIFNGLGSGNILLSVQDPVIYQVYSAGSTVMNASEYRMSIPGDSDSYKTYNYVYEVSPETTSERGNLIQSGIIAEDGAYPNNGPAIGYWWVKGSRVNQSIAPPGPFTVPAPGTVFKPSDQINIVWGASTAANLTIYEIERSFNEDGQFVNMSPVTAPNTSYSYGKITDKTKTKLQFRVRAKNSSGVYSDWIYSDVYVIQHNVIPTILLNTANNFIMSETEGQNEVLVDGSARDNDANDNIIIKMQINDGTIRNIQSGLSDGSTPIEFSKKITYSNKRVYDGATPLTNDLAENVDHTLKVWADDGQGGISTVEERKFRVIHNRPPVISGTDEDLGEILEIPSITYQVDDPEKQTATITERINGQIIRTFDAELGKEYKIEIPIEMWIPLQLEKEHIITIEAKDTFGAKSTRTYTFTRTEDTILLELKNPFVTDIAATRLLVTPDVYLPIGSTILIEACNNAFDEVPTWEDITGMAMNKRGYNFTNTEKTAEQWGVNIRFTINKGTAHDQVRFNGFGGAFD